MDYSGQNPQGASSQRKKAAPSGASATSARISEVPAAGKLRLVQNTLNLMEPPAPVAWEWTCALEALAQAYKLAVQIGAPGQVTARREAEHQADQCLPVFAPWENVSIANLGAEHAFRFSPQPIWAASYLYDCGVDRPAAQRCVDIMLMSPHPDACVMDDNCVDSDGGAALPQTGAISAMVNAAREEGRARLAIIVPSRCCNAMKRCLVAADDEITEGELAIEVLAIEDAIGLFLGDPLGWDAIIATPELRGIVLAILAQTTGVAGPWPILWHDSGLRLVGSETLADQAGPLPLDATLLLHSLALVARRTGLGYEASRLHESWARLRDQGVTTHHHDNAFPYLNQVSESDFIALACAEPDSHTRPLPAWKALDTCHRNNAPDPAVQLKLVASS